MNAQTILMNQLQNQLKMKNPQALQQLQNLKNPQEMINKMFSNVNQEQLNSFKQFANGFGISNEEINKYITLKG